MRKRKTNLVQWGILLLCLVSLAFGWLGSNMLLQTAGAIGMCCLLVRIVYQRRTPLGEDYELVENRPVPFRPAAKPPSRKPIDPNDKDALVDEMLSQARFALLLRPQIAKTLEESQFHRAIETLEETMGLVPDGDVILGQIDDALYDGRLDADEIAERRGRIVQVERLFLDRFPVTNLQYYEFVAAGGYEQMALWDKQIWTAVLDFVDRTGMPGPRYWRDGCYLEGEENHPVVGVSWYEANAYARWLGKRLPTDAEWVKAGSWPVQLSATARTQRKFPWGESMDPKRANVWNSSVGHIIPVDECSQGVSVGGIYQLIGNVWEWTSGSFHPTDHARGELALTTPIKNIRGGAFDTYFDNQATCQFQSGEGPLGRRHNIGFRCAVGVCDLTLARPTAGSKQSAEQTIPEQTLPEQPSEATEEVPV